MIVLELIVLSAWGYVTPGQVIPDSQAIVIVGGVALSTVILSMLTYRTRRMFHSNHSVGGSLVRFIETPFKFPFLTIIFIIL